MKKIQQSIEKLLKTFPKVKGYHGLEFWTALDSNILELHVFFDGSLNISEVHENISQLEQKIREINIENLQEIVLHSEPLEGRTDGTIF